MAESAFQLDFEIGTQLGRQTRSGKDSLLKSLQVIIDSQPLTVAILAPLLFGESIGFVGGAGLVLGVIGLLLLETTRRRSSVKH